MIYAVDHVVMAVSVNERDALARRLLEAGLREIPLHLEFPEIGAASDSYATASGGFVELVYEITPGGAPRAWFTELPRVIGVGFSSDDFEADVLAWVGHEGAWSMNENHVLADGSKLNIRAAGPHPHFEDFYVFVMDRPDGLPYREHGADARLEALTLKGERADEWRDRLAGYLGIESKAGDVALGFTQGSHPNVRASLGLRTPSAQRPIKLAAGDIRFTA